MPPLEAVLNLDDFERVAQQVLSRAGWGYYACAGDDGYSASTILFRGLCTRTPVQHALGSSA